MCEDKDYLKNFVLGALKNTDFDYKNRLGSIYLYFVGKGYQCVAGLLAILINKNIRDDPHSFSLEEIAGFISIKEKKSLLTVLKKIENKGS